MGQGYDAILVPGGGLRDGGELPEYVKRRFDLALARQSGELIVPLSAWTTHRAAVLDSEGRQMWESLGGAHYLMERGITPDQIFCESTSYDTIGNAYFSRVQLAEPLGWRRLLIVTSQFHMPRTEAVFRWVYSLDARPPYDLEFAASPDEGLSEAALAARQAREATSLESVQHHSGRMRSMRDLALFMFTEHRAYRSVREPMARHDADLMQSY